MRILSILLVLFVQQALAERSGIISQAPCPYSCKTQGILKKDCRDWKLDNTCYIEDLRLVPEEPENKIKLDKVITENNKSYIASPVTNPESTQNPLDCKNTARADIPPPRINIDRTKPSNTYVGDIQRIFGSVEGACIIEAAYYEYGKKIQGLLVETSRDFKIFKFNIKFRPDRDPQIRVYNVHGDRAVEYLGENKSQHYYHGSRY